VHGLTGWDIHDQELAALDELGVAEAEVVLHVEEVPSGAEERGGDDARGLLVVGLEGTSLIQT
jgi:hypothetical protein